MAYQRLGLLLDSLKRPRHAQSMELEMMYQEDDARGTKGKLDGDSSKMEQ